MADLGEWELAIRSCVSELWTAGEVRRPLHAALHEWSSAGPDEPPSAPQAADGAMQSFGSMTL